MLLRLATVLFLALLGGSASAAPKAVVELFTSQGCSSCPPADAFVGELAKRDDVLPLVFHVGYWDYLGWKDTFGIAESAERQAAYAAVQNDRRLFTPEIIVNGRDHFLGSNRASVLGTLAKARLPVPVTIEYRNDELFISVGAELPPGPNKTTVRLITFISEAEVAIQRGENRGSTITYHNVVRSIRPIGMWNGHSLSVTLPADEVLADGADGCAVLVQEELAEGPGKIIGAASVLDPDS